MSKREVSSHVSAERKSLGIYPSLYPRVLSSVSLLQRLSCQYSCLLGKNRQRQSYYLQGMQRAGMLAMAGPSWRCLPLQVQERTDKAVLPSSGKAHHGAPGAICMVPCRTSPRTVTVSGCRGRRGGSEYRFLEALI